MAEPLGLVGCLLSRVAVMVACTSRPRFHFSSVDEVDLTLLLRLSCGNWHLVDIVLSAKGIVLCSIRCASYDLCVLFCASLSVLCLVSRVVGSFLSLLALR